jgi:hypothetical protein
MRHEMTCNEFVGALDRWAGQSVAIRLTAEGPVLLAVFHGVLRERSDEKRPALFWPLVHAEPGEHADHREDPGVYLHPDEVEAAAVHVGEPS